jgi:uncharacterized beta barrel domain-containing protein DUF5777
VTRRPSASTVLSLVLPLVFMTAPAFVSGVYAQDPPADVTITSATPTQAPDDDPAALDPLEPDFSIVNLPTTLRLPVRGWDFHLTHRFNQNLLCVNNEPSCLSHKLQTLFGLDTGANIGLEFRFGIARNLQAVVHRTSLSQIIQVALQYDAWHQNASHPVSISGIAAIEGDHNLGASTPGDENTHYSPSLGLVVSRKIANRLAVYLEPFWVHNTAGEGLPTRDTAFLGVGGRLRLSSTVSLVGDVEPRIGGLAIREPHFGFGIEKRVGGHVFALTFTNDPGTTFRQISSGGNAETLNLGFNLSRKFY